MADREANGPVARLCGPEHVAAVSRTLGIPVAGADPAGPHDERCGGCQGTGDRETCRYSVRLREVT